MKEKYANFRGAKIIEVMEIEVNEGEGEKDDPLYRETYYIKLDGTMIGKKTKEPLRMLANEC